jgi:hypothetical protein
MCVLGAWKFDARDWFAHRRPTFDLITIKFMARQLLN